MTLGHREFLRYSRQMMVADIGEVGQERLKNSQVAIIGLGGLGSPASLYLAAAGVGSLILVDPDSVDLTNLQRQILYRDGDIDKAKSKVAAKRLRQLNPDIKIDWIQDQFEFPRLEPLLQHCDLVLDCTDNMKSRQAINRACQSAAKPLVSASALGWEGQLLDLPLDQNESACLACVYGNGDAEPAQTCATAGVIGPVLGMMGSSQALLAIAHLTGNRTNASSRLHRFDGKSFEWSRFDLAKSANCPVCCH